MEAKEGMSLAGGKRMDFPRQWFPPYFALGLSTNSILFDSLLSQKRFVDAHALVINELKKDSRGYWERMHKKLKRIERYFSSEHTSNSIRIIFLSFWPDFDIESNQILDWIRLSCPALEVKIVKDPDDADIAIFSCYGNNSFYFPHTEHCDRWLFLGENVRPEFFNYDCCLGFDLGDYHSKNIHLPLWLFEIDFFNKSYNDRSPRKIRSYTCDRYVDYSNRQNAVAYIGNNAEPLRESIITFLQLSKIRVDRYGSHTNPVTDKIDMYSKYKVVLATENSYWPGYVTEKLMHAHLSGSHIIYWGGAYAKLASPINFFAEHIYIPDQIIDSVGLRDFVLFAFLKTGPVRINKLVEASHMAQYLGHLLSSINYRLKCYM
jgi:hypothetical protein